MKHALKRVKWLLLLAAMAGLQAPASAHEAAERVLPSAVADSSRVVDLDEVVVVSQPKEQFRLRRQPLSASMFDAAELEQLHVDDLRQLSDYVPSFVMPDYGSRYTSSMYIRGIGSRVNSPAVGVYVDNIPLMNKSMFNFHTYEVDRIDVLRGPQGTLYGQNTEGGLVRIYSRNPLGYQGTDVRLGVATGLQRKAEVAHHHRVNSQLGYSLSAFYEGQNGFFKNQATGQRADEYNEGGLKTRLVYLADDRLSLNWVADYQYVKQNGFPYGLLDLSSGKAEAPSTNRQGDYRRHLLNTGLSAGYKASWAELNYTASWQYLKDDMLMDIDYRPQDFMHLTQAQLTNALTQELTLKSASDARWQWAFGGFYSYQWLKTDAPVYFDDDMNRFLSSTIESAAYNGMLNAMAARMGWERAQQTIERAGGCHITVQMDAIPGLFRTPQANYGLFHESNIGLTQRLTATLGLRYDLSQVAIDYATRAQMALDENVMGVQVNAVVTSVLERKEQSSFNQWLPKVGLSYRIDAQGSNVYATVAKGYRAGGFNIQMFSDILQTELQSRAQTARADMAIAHSETDYQNIRQTIAYKPEESWNYEAGAHLNLFSGSVQADFAAFYMLIRNQQLSVMAGNYGFGRMMVNAGKSYSCGVEASLRGRAANNRLNWSLSYGCTHAVFKEYVDSMTVDGQTVAVDYHDKRVPFVPMHTLAASADYRFCFSGPMQALTVGANVSAQGKTYWDESNTYAQRLYGVLGAHVSASFGRVMVDLWGRNLTDTRYNTFALSSSATGSLYHFAQRGRPLQVGLDVKLHL